MTGDWTFNEDKAAQFDSIAATNIPNYERVVQKCVEIARASFPDTNAKMIDVGCATGHTMELLRAAGYTNVYGVDNSQAMLDRCRVRENLILSDSFPREAGPFDLIFANWTLHFIPERKKYLADIFDTLAPGGILVLSEKMLSSDLVHDRYHDFKRSNGLTDRQILEKAQAIEGVLIPLPLEWYFETLRELGFKRPELIDAHWCFATLLASK